MIIFLVGFIIIPMLIIWAAGGYDKEADKDDWKRRDSTDYYDGGAGV